MNLVLTPEAWKPFLHFFKGVGAADGFDGFIFGVFLAAAVGRIGEGRVGRQGALCRGGGLLALGGRFERSFVRFGRWERLDHLLAGRNFGRFAWLLFSRELLRPG